MAFTSTFRSQLSIRLILSYIIDWIIIVGIAAAGGGFSLIAPNRRPFDVTDPELSYPLTEETISTAVLFLVSLVAPALLIFIIALSIGLGPAPENYSKITLLKRKLWEWNAGWMGLCVAYAVAFLITNGTKEVVGKPRPNLLARCDPDLSRISNSTVGGIGGEIEAGINLVSWTICRQTDMELLDEGFRSFPSGHSSLSFAGLTYLALYFCAKFAITIPFLNYNNLSHSTGLESLKKPLRSQAAAPPTYLLVFPVVTFGAAIYISSTRYSDFWHHGFDVIAGAIVGIISAWLGFRWYHLPISRGGGWAWAPRSPKRAFGRGIGALTYVDDNPPASKGYDLESGPMLGGEHTAVPSTRGMKNSNSSGGMELNDMSAARGYGHARVNEPNRGYGNYGANDPSRRPLG